MYLYSTHQAGYHQVKLVEFHMLTGCSVRNPISSSLVEGFTEDPGAVGGVQLTVSEN